MNTEFIKDHLRKIILSRNNLVKFSQESIQGYVIDNYKDLLLNKLSNFDTQGNANLAWSKFVLSMKLSDDAIAASDTFPSERRKILFHIDRYIEDIQRELQDQRLTDEEVSLIAVPAEIIKPIFKIPKYSACDLGSFDNLVVDNQSLHTYDEQFIDKIFVGEKIDSSSVEISFEVIPPHSGSAALHTHNQNEEVYVFLKGSGVFQVNEEVFRVTEGTIVRVSPQGKRAWKNNSDSPMLLMAIQARKGLLKNFTDSDEQMAGDELLFEG